MEVAFNDFIHIKRSFCKLAKYISEHARYANCHAAEFNLDNMQIYVYIVVIRLHGERNSIIRVMASKGLLVINKCI